MSNRGILYISSTEEYVKQAIESARSVKNHNNIDIAIIAPKIILDNCQVQIFDKLIPMSDYNGDVRDKRKNLLRTPFDETLYIDSDTLVMGDVTPAFNLLDRVDIAASIAPKNRAITISSVPECFPELNTGVIVFNMNSNVRNLFTTWKQYHEKQVKEGRPKEKIIGRDVNNMSEMNLGVYRDQPPFREALFNTDIKYGVLPKEYNFRLFGSCAYGEVKIIHDSSRVRLRNVINNKLGLRVYISNKVIWQDGHKRYLRKQIPVVDTLIRKFPIGKILDKIGLKHYADNLYTKIQNFYSKS